MSVLNTPAGCEICQKCIRSMMFCLSTFDCQNSQIEILIRKIPLNIPLSIFEFLRYLCYWFDYENLKIIKQNTKDAKYPFRYMRSGKVHISEKDQAKNGTMIHLFTSRDTHKLSIKSPSFKARKSTKRLAKVIN